MNAKTAQTIAAGGCGWQRQAAWWMLPCLPFKASACGDTRFCHRSPSLAVIMLTFMLVGGFYVSAGLGAVVVGNMATVAKVASVGNLHAV